MSEYGRQHFKDNRNEILERNKKYREANKEKKAAQDRCYYENNKEKCSKYIKNYYELNKDRLTEYKRQYYTENKTRIREQHKQYYGSNKNKAKERNKCYRESYKEKIAEQNKKYYIANKEKIKERSREYHKLNIDKWNIWKQRRRAKEKELPHELTAEQWGIIKDAFNNRCCYCGKELPLTQDHFIALDNGGEFSVNNIVPACKSCNSSKNNKKFFLWYPKHKHYSKKREKRILEYLKYKNGVQQMTLAL